MGNDMVICATYDIKHKALLIQGKRELFIPSYLYYYLEYLEGTKGHKINQVVFLFDTSRTYKKKELKGINNWLELDQTDIERID